MNREQVKAVIKLLKSKDLKTRPPLQQVFEQGGYLWATDGYVALEICEVKEEMKNKRITLEALIGWYATHTKKTDRLGTDIMTDNEYQQPDMDKLLHTTYEKPTEPPKFNVDYLKLACDFLGVKSITLEQHENCYRVKPLSESEMDIMTRAMESKAYVMGLIN